MAASSSSALTSSNIRARDQETGRRRRQAWSTEEDQVLLEALRTAKQAAGVQDQDDTASADPETISHISWAMVASKLPGRTAKDCRKRLVYSLDVNLRKGAWTEEEDQLLLDAMSAYVNLRNGDLNKIKWSAIARVIGSRSGDQASKRWREVLNPALNRAEWSQEEDSRLIALIDSHRSGQDAASLNDWTFPAAPCPSSTSPPSTSSDASNIRLNCSWNEIAKQHGTRTALQVRNRFMLIKQLKNGGIPASISRLGPVRQNMYRAKLSSFSSRASTSSSGASDDGNSPSFLRNTSSSSRPRASSVRSAPKAMTSYDERGGIHPSVGTSSSWQSPSLFATAGIADGSPAHWNSMQQASWAPTGLPASMTVSPETLMTADHQPPAFTLPPSFFSHGHSQSSSSFSTSAPASLDSLWSHSGPVATSTAADAAAAPTDGSFCHPLFGMVPAMDGALPWSYASSNEPPASTFSLSLQQQQQQPTQQTAPLLSSFDSDEPRSMEANEFSSSGAPAQHPQGSTPAKINIFGGAFVL